MPLRFNSAADKKLRNFGSACELCRLPSHPPFYREPLHRRPRCCEVARLPWTSPARPPPMARNHENTLRRRFRGPGLSVCRMVAQSVPECLRCNVFGEGVVGRPPRPPLSPHASGDRFPKPCLCGTVPKHPCCSTTVPRPWLA